MAIFFHEEEVSLPKYFQKKTTKVWVKSVVRSFEKTTGEINYIFCSDEYLLNINKTYLSHETYTDTITFDYTENNTISGDIYISLDRVFENAKTFQNNPDKELNRVMIHGILHLCGLKDKTAEEREKMREAENRFLSELD